MKRARLILASASPRRRELLARLGLRFAVDPSHVDEPAGAVRERPERLARRLAVAKAREVARREPEAVIVGADTVVAHRGELLGKPRDASEARMMLHGLRARTHRVVTAVALAPPGTRRVLVDHARTRVTMRAYGDDEIEESVARGDPFDKAGAYAIQDEHLRPVASYEGCYCNVVGLPLWTVVVLLDRAGERPGPSALRRMPAVCRSCPLRE